MDKLKEVFWGYKLNILAPRTSSYTLVFQLLPLNAIFLLVIIDIQDCLELKIGR